VSEVGSAAATAAASNAVAPTAAHHASKRACDPLRECDRDGDRTRIRMLASELSV
jgi:hypothetical protein